MKIFALLCCTGLLLFWCSPSACADTTGQQRAQAAGRGLVGSSAPHMILKTIDGDTINLGDLYGKKAIYLKFWATWCAPCREQMPHFEHVYETAGPDLAVIAVDVGFNESVADIQRYRKALGIKMPIVLDDGTLDGAFKLRVTPQHIVIGRDGRILYVGHLADAQLDAALLLARTTSPIADSTPGRTAGTEATHYGVGDLLPATAVKTLEGRTIRLSSRKSGRATVLVFLSPWCESYLATTRPAIAASCRDARAQVAAAAEKSHARWLGVASGLWAAPEDLKKYRDQYRINIPLTLDESGVLFRAFRVLDVPTVVIADPSGKITRRVDSVDSSKLRDALKDL